MILSINQAFKGEMAFQITEESLPIRATQLRARLRLYPVMILSQAILEPLFVWLFWKHFEPVYLLAWLTLFYTLHTVDLWFWWRYRKQLDTVEQCNWWNVKFRQFTVLTASMWALISICFFPPELASQALLICLVLGLVAGAVTFDSVYPPSLYIYVIGVSTPLLIRLLLVADDTHFILSAMLLFFIIGSVSAGRELGRTFWKSLWQRYENDQLIVQLTEQRAIADAANRDKSRFLAAASHDLRQPLQALVLFSDAINVASTEEDTRHLSAQISKSVGVLVGMFDELLDISKFDAGVIRANKEHFRLQDIFDHLLTDFTPLAETKSLQFSIQESTLTGYSDAHLFERILRNLIANAIKYTETGKVDVTCQLVDTGLQVSVADTGIGIREENIPHIFEEYYQVDNQHRDRLRGLGLGLAIVSRLATLLSCKVNIDSTYGRGSVFSVIIPAGEATLIRQAAPPLMSKHDLGGKTIALIDDHLDIRQRIVGLLKQWGCHSYDGESAELVFEQISRDGKRPDMLISDYRLPNEVSALNVIALLRERWGEGTPALILTGDTAPHTLQEIKKSGALVIHKPITPARLRSVIYAALHQEHS
jgi:two-component system, sensor histidine kinase